MVSSLNEPELDEDHNLLAQLVASLNVPEVTVESLLTFDDNLATDCTLATKDWQNEIIENIVAEMSEPVITQELEADDDSNSNGLEETHNKSQIMVFMGYVRSFLAFNAPDLVNNCLALENAISYRNVQVKQSSINDFYTAIA